MKEKPVIPSDLSMKAEDFDAMMRTAIQVHAPAKNAGKKRAASSKVKKKH